jgi:MscS family membrane protein
VTVATIACVMLAGAAPVARDSTARLLNRPRPVLTGSLASPRSAVQGFLIEARGANYVAATRYLDLSGLPETDREHGRRLARELKVVLDQRLWIDIESLSESPEGNLQDGLPADRERVGTILTSRGSTDIRLRRTIGPGGDGEWRFSPGSIDRVEALYDQVGYGPMLDWLPEWATGMRLGNVEGWQWIGLLLLAGLAILVSRTLTGLAYWIVRSLTRNTDPGFRERVLDSIRPPARLISALGVVVVGALVLRLPIPAGHMLTKVIIGLVITLFTWAAMRLVDLAVVRTIDRLRSQGRRSGVSTLVLMRRIIKGVIMVIGALVLLQNIGFNVTGILAGFGIVGAAIALAAQKTIENLFGGLVLTADEPVRIGDMCRFGDKQGVIEDIGLRSTRVRTLDRTVVSVPNAEMSSIQIENFNVRDRVRLLTTLDLRYETTNEQMKLLLSAIRELLKTDPRVVPDDVRVRFVGFGPYSLRIEVVAYVKTVDWAEFLEIQEDLFLRIMTIVNDSGAGFAFPSQTMYVARDTMNEAGVAPAAPVPPGVPRTPEPLTTD